MNITVRLDGGFDHSLDLIGPFFDALHGRDQAAGGKTEQLVGSG